MARKFIKYPSNYVNASTYNTSKYEIVGFTPESYERLKSFDGNSWDNTFGYIQMKDAPYAIDVVYEDMPQWTVYALNALNHGGTEGVEYNDDLEIGVIDTSLPYDNQVDFLISTLEKVVARYNR